MAMLHSCKPDGDADADHGYDDDGDGDDDHAHVHGGDDAKEFHLFKSNGCRLKIIVVTEKGFDNFFEITIQQILFFVVCLFIFF